MVFMISQLVSSLKSYYKGINFGINLPYKHVFCFKGIYNYEKWEFLHFGKSLFWGYKDNSFLIRFRKTQ